MAGHCSTAQQVMIWRVLRRTRIVSFTNLKIRTISYRMLDTKPGSVPQHWGGQALVAFDAFLSALATLSLTSYESYGYRRWNASHLAEIRHGVSPSQSYGW